MGLPAQGPLGRWPLLSPERAPQAEVELPGAATALEAAVWPFSHAATSCEAAAHLDVVEDWAGVLV